MFVTARRRRTFAVGPAPALPPEVVPPQPRGHAAACAAPVVVRREPHAVAPAPPRFRSGRSVRYRSGVFCVHFSADGREHGMWFPDGPGVGQGPPPPLPAGLSARWYQAGSGVAWAHVCRRGEVLCDALMLTEDDKPRESAPACTHPSGRAATWLLRPEGFTTHQAALLAGLRQRPLLATVSRRAEFPPEMARQVHRLLLSAPSEPGDGCGEDR